MSSISQEKKANIIIYYITPRLGTSGLYPPQANRAVTRTIVHGKLVISQKKGNVMKGKQKKGLVNFYYQYVLGLKCSDNNQLIKIHTEKKKIVLMVINQRKYFLKCQFYTFLNFNLSYLKLL